jgi:hypothetical protein
MLIRFPMLGESGQNRHVKESISLDLLAKEAHQVVIVMRPTHKFSALCCQPSTSFKSQASSALHSSKQQVTI